MPISSKVAPARSIIVAAVCRSKLAPWDGGFVIPARRKRSANDSGDDHARSEGAEWRFRAEKDSIDGSPWARMFDVVQNGVSCILRQR